MNTIIVREEDLDFEKYDGCCSPFMFDDFDLIVYTEDEKIKIEIKTVSNGMIYRINHSYWVGITAAEDIKEIYPEDGQMVVALDKTNGDIIIGRMFIPMDYVSDSELDFLQENLLSPEGYKAYTSIACWICNILCTLMMMGKEERIRRQRRSGQSFQHKPKAYTESKKHKVFLLEDIVNYISDHYVDETTRKFNCPCWDVRGHYRHYKSGKVVFVPSYRKGKQRDKAQPKDKEYYA